MEQRRRQTMLYFIAAALFAIAAGISVLRSGFTPKVFLGAVMAVALVLLGQRNARSDR
ncbi:MAG: hypothetical protein QOH81_1237 [Sphingomonadales bacterium]|jgi:hypothetical protein|nr:hypothetical protein [Sphingomonadales bacterium]